MRAGTLLEQRVGAPMPIGQLLSLASGLAGELAELHGRGVIHEDLKPAGILFNDATGKIALASSESGASGLPRLLAGSLPYMSPEQTGKMNRPIDSRSDLYSLGVVLYQLLAGRLPFEAEDAVGWMHCHLARQPPPLDQVRPSLPRPLADIVGKLLAKLPDHRYQSALGLRHDLERCLREWSEHGAIAAFPLGELTGESDRERQGLTDRHRCTDPLLEQRSGAHLSRPPARRSPRSGHSPPQV